MDLIKRNLITGGCGFLGSHLEIKDLLKKGEEVICLDNFFTGTKRNIKTQFEFKNFEFIKHDVTEPIKLEVDNIWHLDLSGKDVHYQLNPIKTTKTSFMSVLIICLD